MSRLLLGVLRARGEATAQDGLDLCHERRSAAARQQRTFDIVGLYLRAHEREQQRAAIILLGGGEALGRQHVGQGWG